MDGNLIALNARIGGFWRERIDWRNEAGSMQPYRGWSPGCDLAAFDDPSNKTMPRVLEVFSVRFLHISICRVKKQGTNFRVDEQAAMSSFADMKIRCHEIFGYAYAIGGVREAFPSVRLLVRRIFPDIGRKLVEVQDHRLVWLPALSLYRRHSPLLRMWPSIAPHRLSTVSLSLHLLPSLVCTSTFVP